jgi:predicted nucleic acid-binding protein
VRTNSMSCAPLCTSRGSPNSSSLTKAGRLVNQIKKLAEDVDPLPPVIRSPDPTDDFLLAVSEAGKADYLVTGDKGGLLALDCHKPTRIISASDFAALFA